MDGSDDRVSLLVDWINLRLPGLSFGQEDGVFAVGGSNAIGIEVSDRWGRRSRVCRRLTMRLEIQDVTEDERVILGVRDLCAGGTCLLRTGRLKG